MQGAVRKLGKSLRGFGIAKPAKAFTGLSEEQQQILLLRWIAHFPLVSEALIAIPNGGKRGKYEAYRLKLQGVKAGVSDLFLAIPMHGKAGLWLEMKRADGKLTALQKKWLGLMELLGFAVVTAYSFEQAKQAIIDYIAGFQNAPERVLNTFTYDRRGI